MRCQGGPFALRSALNAPQRIEALVLIEPSATGEYASADLSPLAGKPVLLVYGDRWKDSPRWVKTRASVDLLAQRLQKAGARVEWLDLPARGIRGNSHMLMMDRNSDEIAALVQDWFERVGVMR